MANLTNASDLRIDALRLANEVTDGTSAYHDRVFEYLTRVQVTLLSGGQLGPLPVRVYDWWWARKSPRGVLRLVSPTNIQKDTQITLTKGSAAATLDVSVPTTMTAWRLAVTGQAARPYISSNSGTAITLSGVWTGDDTTTLDWVAYQEDYTLASDLQRLVSPLFIDVPPYTIRVGDPRGLGMSDPVTLRDLSEPCAAAWVGERTVRFDHYPEEDVLAEYEYLVTPDALDSADDVPLIPYQHRPILSYGAAVFLLLDKEDGKVADILPLFERAWRAMVDEQESHLRHGSPLYGRVIPRPSRRQRIRTLGGGALDTTGWGGGWGAGWGS